MGWLSTLIKKNNHIEVPVPDTDFPEYDHQPLPTSSMTNGLQLARSLISDAASRTAHVYGLPADWLSFEVFTIADDEKAYFQLQILMNHWDESLLMHSYAFESAVIKRIREESVDVGRALRAVHWRVAPDAGCPYDAMPEPQYWSADAIKERGLVRQRLQREIYAATTPASGAVAPPALAPVNTFTAAKTGPDIGQLQKPPTQENHGFTDTHPRNLTGFSATHPYDPKTAKKTAEKTVKKAK
jgi:hypothetical protein